MAMDELALQVKAPPSLEKGPNHNPQIENEAGKKELRKYEEDKSGSQETRKKKGSYYNSWDFRSGFDFYPNQRKSANGAKLMGSAT